MVAHIPLVKPAGTTWFSPLRGFHSPLRQFDSAPVDRRIIFALQNEGTQSLCLTVNCK